MSKTLDCKVVKIEENIANDCNELLICEYPLTIILNQKKIATLLCSPENLKAMTLGFLRTERFIAKVEDVTYFKLDEARSVVEVETENKDVSVEKFHSKKVDLRSLQDDNSTSVSNFFDSVNCEPVESNIVLPFQKIYEFMEKNLSYSQVFRKTGGAHCVSLCDTEDIMVTCEDVARHNALDKVIGESLIRKIFLKDKIIILSGRVSFEMILKAAKLQIPIVISKSAPTSLSVALAKKLNITLIGFVRGRKMNIYANEQRIKY